MTRQLPPTCPYSYINCCPYGSLCQHCCGFLQAISHRRLGMYRFWAAGIIQLLFGVLACASTSREERNTTRTPSFSIDSQTVDQIVEYLSHEESETHWWRMVDVTNDSTLEVLDRWNITQDELQERSQLCGNASAMHIHAYLATQKLLENSTCPQVSYQMLDHGRLIRVDHTTALKYGNVYGNMTGKGGSCAAKLVERSLEIMKRQQSRTYSYYAAKAILTTIGFGGLHFSIWNECEIDIQENGELITTRLGQRVCSTIAFFSTVSLGIALQTWIVKDVVHEATRAGMFMNANNVDARGSQFNDIGHDQINYYHVSKRGLNLDAPDVPTDWLHGYHKRNLTYGELMSANFTHRTAIHYEDPTNGYRGPVEIWHQEHPDRPEELTTHVAIHPHLSAEELKQAHEKRSVCSFNDWGTTLNSGWEAHWCKNGIGSDAPTSIYYGFETYNPSLLAAFQSDVGAANNAYNGFVHLIDDIEKHVYQQGGWDECICFQEQGTWISTGILQFSWNDVYNGYSRCWDFNCGLGHDEL